MPSFNTYYRGGSPPRKDSPGPSPFLGVAVTITALSLALGVMLYMYDETNRAT